MVSAALSQSPLQVDLRHEAYSPKQERVALCKADLTPCSGWPDQAKPAPTEKELAHPPAPQRPGSHTLRPLLFLNPSKSTADSNLSLGERLLPTPNFSGSECSGLSSLSLHACTDKKDHVPSESTIGLASSANNKASFAISPASAYRSTFGPAHRTEPSERLGLASGATARLNSASGAAQIPGSGRTRTGSSLYAGSPHAKSTLDPHKDDPARHNIFFISNTPSPPAPQSGSRQNSVRGVAQPGFVARTVKRLDSLFDGIGHVPQPLSSVSSSDISEDEDEDEDGDTAGFDGPEPRSSQGLETKLAKSARSINDTESEWMSMSLDGEGVSELPKTQPIQFKKRPQPPLLAPSTRPSGLQVDTQTLLFKPRSLLSGLFSSESATSPRLAPSEPSEPPFKPVLKSLATSHVITVDSQARDMRSVLRPSIFVSKRYGSVSDVTKHAAQRSPIVLITEEDSAPASHDPLKPEDALFAKQTLSVGLLNLMVMAEGRDDGGPEQALSSSLSKFTVHPPSLFKQMLLKSSLNLSQLFSQSKKKQSDPKLAVMLQLFAGYLLQQNLMEALRAELREKPVKVEPKAMKTFEPLVEISASLRDSLIIDHKLGKVPMPDRVISDENLQVQGQELEPSDYYSKGW